MLAEQEQRWELRNISICLIPPASKKAKLLIYKNIHRSCTKDAQLDHCLLHVMSKALNFDCLLSSKRSNKN